MLIQLMWEDVIGPTLETHKTDQATENNLMALFKQGDLQASLGQWDLDRRAAGGVTLTLKTLLED